MRAMETMAGYSIKNYHMVNRDFDWIRTFLTEIA